MITQPVVYDWSDTKNRQRLAVVYDADTGERIQFVQRVELTVGWVRRDNGSIVGQAMVTVICKDDCGIPITERHGKEVVIKKETMQRRIRIEWK